MSEPQIDSTIINLGIETAVHTPLTNRTYEQYMNALGIKEKDLGKIVLDLGSGQSEKFARTAHEKGISVISINPRLADQNDPTSFDLAALNLRKEEINDQVYDNIKTKDIGKTVVAIAQKLPFSDDTFDSVVSLWGVPLYLRDEDIEKGLTEVLRVLTPMGKGFLGPLRRTQREDIENILSMHQVKHEFAAFSSDFEISPEYSTLIIEK